MDDQEPQGLKDRIAGLLSSRRQHRPAGRPVLIGVAGGTASGKSTLARALADRLQPLRVRVIGQDTFFKPVAELPTFPSPSRDRPWPDYNRPDSFKVHTMLECCRSLDSLDVAVLEGILVLSYPEARELMDLRLYVEADADERIVRRIRRNLQNGMSLDDVADYYLESVRLQHERYNAPTRSYADLIIPGGSAQQAAREMQLNTLVRAIRSQAA